MTRFEDVPQKSVTEALGFIIHLHNRKKISEFHSYLRRYYAALKPSMFKEQFRQYVYHVRGIDLGLPPRQ